MIGQPELFPRYCIDSSVLINIIRGYPRDLFPTIWEKLERLIKEDKLVSHIEVYNEIKNGKDSLLVWCKQNKKMFIDIDDCQRMEIKKIQKKYNPSYWNLEINKNGPWADPWLIALSICENLILVTDEGNSENRIPYIANILKVKCLGRIDFFREIDVKY